jgi:hypothetical protein
VNEATAQPLKDPFTNATPKPGTPKIEDVNNDGKIDAAIHASPLKIQSGSDHSI